MTHAGGWKNGAIATAEDVAFDAAPKEIDEVEWPKVMGGGCKPAVAGESYRVSFVQPNGAPDITDELVADLADVAGSFGDARKGRAAGKAWKELLGLTA